MSFFEIVKKYENKIDEDLFLNVTDAQVKRVLNKEYLKKEDFLVLLSEKASEYLDEMALRARELSLKHFGKSIVLYTPMYISNYCINRCSYCSFNVNNRIKRKKLNLEQVRLEAKAIAKTGLKHILILTGENKTATNLDYLLEVVEICKEYFESTYIEIFPMTSYEYKKMIEAGVDGLTIYQETYNRDVYKEVHLSGPKRDYKYRLDAPERACQEGINFVNIGALLGLDNFRKEIFFTGLHGEYLNKKYPAVDVSFSLPRIKPIEGGVPEYDYEIDNKKFLQAMFALRLFMPYAAINISTREDKEFRKNLIPFGVNKMSAGVSTKVGGHIDLENSGDEQFQISDVGSVSSVKEMIAEAGYQPVMKDWFKI